ncbi:MAG: CBS domain-containing protein [Acidobacteriota bacterium]
MKVKAIMTRAVRWCTPETTAREAALAMRQVDCGILPVLRNGRLAGVVTDRDLCLALAERDCRPGELSVGDAMSRGLWACREDDDVQTALDTMCARRVRRLPVVDAAGNLRGILCMNDVVREAGADLDGPVSPDEVLRALQAIGEHRYPARKEDNVDVTALSRFVSESHG